MTASKGRNPHRNELNGVVGPNVGSDHACGCAVESEHDIERNVGKTRAPTLFCILWAGPLRECRAERRGGLRERLKAQLAPQPPVVGSELLHFDHAATSSGPSPGQSTDFKHCSMV